MTDTNQIFLDANVLLEVVLARAKQTQARSLITRHENRMMISPLTSHLVVHFGYPTYELSDLRRFLAGFTTAALTATDVEWAFTNIVGSDFEDALQIGVAIREGCREFVTLDQKLVKRYSKLPQLTMTHLT